MVSKNILGIFKGLDDKVREKLADLQRPLDLALAALKLAKDAGYQKLSAEEMSDALAGAGVSVSPKALLKALARAGSRVYREKENGIAVFSIMTRGLREIAPLLKLGNIGLFYIESGKPRTAHKEIEAIFETLTGEIRICDRYFNLRSIDALEMIPKDRHVRLLTENLKDDRGKLGRRIKDLNREGRKIEIRIPSRLGDMHDRYIISPALYILLGAGLKDIGNRESFVVALARDYVKDLIAQLEHAFDEKWNKAVPL